MRKALFLSFCCVISEMLLAFWPRTETNEGLSSLTFILLLACSSIFSFTTKLIAPWIYP
jgi:hypothetical protein